MNRFRFSFLDKSRKDLWLPFLFDILHVNMKDIAPSGMDYEDEKAQWLAEVGPAMDKASRQIILMFVGEKTVGYFQYYVNGGIFMVEEIQVVPECQGTTLLYALFRFLETVLPEDIETVAAYAHRLNVRSQTIMRKLGMEQAGETDGDFCYFKGNFQSLAGKLFKKK